MTWVVSRHVSEGYSVKTIFTGPPPRGYKWVFCRYRRVRNSDRVLDAHDYGYKAWAFLVRKGG